MTVGLQQKYVQSYIVLELFSELIDFYFVMFLRFCRIFQEPFFMIAIVRDSRFLVGVNGDHVTHIGGLFKYQLPLKSFGVFRGANYGVS